MIDNSLQKQSNLLSQIHVCINDSKSNIFKLVAYQFTKNLFFTKKEKVMRQKIISLALFVFLTSLSLNILAQTTDTAIKPSVIAGDVTSLTANKIVLQTKDGAVEVGLSDKTEYKRVSAESPSLKTAAASNFSDIGVGDKVIVTGILASDKKSIPAKAVYLMTKSDIASKQIKDQEQWKTHGITGQVAAINPQTKEITVTSRGLAAETKTMLTPKDNAIFGATRRIR